MEFPGTGWHGGFGLLSEDAGSAVPQFPGKACVVEFVQGAWLIVVRDS